MNPLAGTSPLLRRMKLIVDEKPISESGASTRAEFRYLNACGSIARGSAFQPCDSRKPLAGLQRIHRHRVGVRFQLSLPAAGEPPQELRWRADRRVVHLLEDAHRQRFRPQQRPAGRLQLARWRIRTGAPIGRQRTDRQLRIYAAIPQSRARHSKLCRWRMAGFRRRRCVHRAADYDHHLWRRSRGPGYWERRPSQLAPRSEFLRPREGGAGTLMAAPRRVRRKAWPGSIPPAASPPCPRASCGR